MTQLPRVLLCSFEVVPSPSGSSRRFLETLKAAARHFQVVALTLKTPELTHIENFHGTRLLRVPSGGGDLEARISTFARAVRRQIDSEEYALVHFTDPFSGQVLCEQRRTRGYRVVYDAARLRSGELEAQESVMLEDPRFLARLRRQELFCLVTADAVLCGSPLTHSYLEGLGVLPEALHLLRTPAGLAFEPSPLPTLDLGARLAYVGSTEVWQGLDTLLMGFARARAQVPLHLTLISPDEPALRARAQALQLPADAVRFDVPTRRDRVAMLLADVDLGMLPLAPGERSQKQGAACAKVSEYLAAGRGVVAADLPAARALLDEEVASFYAPEQPDALAEKLVELARAPKLRERFGALARQKAEREVGIVAFRNALRGIYSRLLGIRLDQAAEGEVEDDTELTEDSGPTVQAVPPNTPPTVPALDYWQALAVYGYCPPPTMTAAGRLH